MSGRKPARSRLGGCWKIGCGGLLGAGALLIYFVIQIGGGFWEPLPPEQEFQTYFTTPVSQIRRLQVTGQTGMDTHVILRFDFSGKLAWNRGKERPVSRQALKWSSNGEGGCLRDITQTSEAQFYANNSDGWVRQRVIVRNGLKHCVEIESYAVVD